MACRLEVSRICLCGVVFSITNVEEVRHHYHVAFSSKKWSWFSELLQRMARNGLLHVGEAPCVVSLVGAGKRKQKKTTG